MVQLHPNHHYTIQHEYLLICLKDKNIETWNLIGLFYI